MPKVVLIPFILGLRKTCFETCPESLGCNYIV